MRILELILFLAVVAILLGFLLGFALSNSVNDFSASPILISTTSNPCVVTSVPEAAPTLTPKPTVTPFPDPAAEGSLGPKGFFRIISPTRGVLYDGGKLTLIVRGEAINRPLTKAYNIDGQGKIPFGAEVTQTREWDKFFGIINAIEALPPLPRGIHSLTVYGSMADVTCQATADFAVA
jgi:hypothetical protein